MASRLLDLLTRLPARWIVLSLLTLYLLTYAGVLHAVDELSALSVAETVLTSGQWHVNQMEWDQARIPPQNAFGRDGNLYSKKGIGVTLVALPLMALGRALDGIGAVQLALLVGAFATPLILYAFFGLVRELSFSRPTAKLAMVALGIGSILWPYSRTLFSEGIAALGLTFALLGAISFRRREYPGLDVLPLVLSGVGLGILLLTKPANGIVIPFFVLYLAYAALRQKRETYRVQRVLEQGLLAGLPVAAALSCVIFYNFGRFGTAFTFPLEPFERFSTPLWAGLAGLLISPGKGYLWYVPLAWLALISVPYWRQKERTVDFALAAASTLALLVLYSRWYDWPGGRAWGPRMIVPIAPAVMMLGLPALDWVTTRQRRYRRRIFVSTVLLASILVQLPAVLVNFEAHEARVMQSGVGFRDLLWQPRLSPLLSSWQALAQGIQDPLWLQPYFWKQDRMLMALFVVSIMAALLLVGAAIWHSARRMRSPRLLWYGALAANATLAITLVTASWDDPRWQERSAIAETNQAMLQSLSTRTAEADAVVLDLLPGNDLAGRQALFLNRGRMLPPLIGWLHRESAADSQHAILSRWLKPHPRVWLVVQEGSNLALPPSTEPWMARHFYLASDEWIEDQRLVQYLQTDQEVVIHLVDVQYESGALLSGFGIGAGMMPDTYAIALVWDEVSDPQLRFSVQALDANGQLVGQVDQAPASLNRVGLVAAAPPAQIIVKLYHSGGGATLAATSAQGVAQPYFILSDLSE